MERQEWELLRKEADVKFKDVCKERNALADQGNQLWSQCADLTSERDNLAKTAENLAKANDNMSKEIERLMEIERIYKEGVEKESMAMDYETGAEEESAMEYETAADRPADETQMLESRGEGRQFLSGSPPSETPAANSSQAGHPKQLISGSAMLHQSPPPQPQPEPAVPGPSSALPSQVSTSGASDLPKDEEVRMETDDGTGNHGSDEAGPESIPLPPSPEPFKKLGSKRNIADTDEAKEPVWRSKRAQIRNYRPSTFTFEPLPPPSIAFSFAPAPAPAPAPPAPSASPAPSAPPAPPPAPTSLTTSTSGTPNPPSSSKSQSKRDSSDEEDDEKWIPRAVKRPKINIDRPSTLLSIPVPPAASATSSATESALPARRPNIDSDDPYASSLNTKKEPNLIRLGKPKPAKMFSLDNPMKDLPVSEVTSMMNGWFDNSEGVDYQNVLRWADREDEEAAYQDWFVATNFSASDEFEELGRHLRWTLEWFEKTPLRQEARAVYKRTRVDNFACLLDDWLGDKPPTQGVRAVRSFTANIGLATLKK